MYRGATGHSNERDASSSYLAPRAGASQTDLHLHLAQDFRPRWSKSLACSVTEKSLNSHELEWRPCHMSLLLRLGGPDVGRDALGAAYTVELWLAVDLCRVFGGCW